MALCKTELMLYMKKKSLLLLVLRRRQAVFAQRCSAAKGRPAHAHSRTLQRAWADWLMARLPPPTAPTLPTSAGPKGFPQFSQPRERTEKNCPWEPPSRSRANVCTDQRIRGAALRPWDSSGHCGNLVVVEKGGKVVSFYSKGRQLKGRNKTTTTVTTTTQPSGRRSDQRKRTRGQKWSRERRWAQSSWTAVSFFFNSEGNKWKR